MSLGLVVCVDRPAVGSAANPQVLDVIRAYIASQTSFTGISQKAKPL